jgi:hypothetical protein
MVDWAGRIDELMHKLAAEHGVDDRGAVEVLLSARIACPRTASTWLILETNWFSRECLDAWFSFGESWVPIALPTLRARQPWRSIEEQTKEWLDNPSDERLFVEPDYERYPYFHRLTQSQYLLQRCLRLRALARRTADPLRWLDKLQQERRAEELAALTRHVLEDRVGARPADPPAFHQPENFLYHCELVQRCAPWYTDWSILVRAFALIAVRRAFLFGRVQTDASDDQAIARVAADSIPPWIAKALRRLLDGPSQMQTLENIMGLEEKTRRSGHGAYRELVRLRRQGVISFDRAKMHWTILDRHREGIRELLDGRAFRARSAAA